MTVDLEQACLTGINNEKIPRLEKEINLLYLY